MPRSGKKAGGRLKGLRKVGQTEADVTLNDFANSQSSRKRLKKPATNAIIREVKELQSCANSNDDLEWFEKDLDDFDLVNSVGMAEEDGDGEMARYNGGVAESRHLVEILTTSTRRRKQWKKGLCQSKADMDSKLADTGVRYPLDVWFLVSEYVCPEDVVTFACICKDALTVVNSMKFWLGLYKRYYNHDAQLPQRLRPECMERPRSLRACVVRSLYYTYPPFVDRLRPMSAFDDKTHSLVRRRCILMWYQRTKNLWNFNFKFRSDGSRFSKGTNNGRSQDLMRLLDDIHANSENGCQVLQVSCNNFIPTPVVMGMILANVHLNTSRKMHHYRLRLTFDATAHCMCSAGGILVTLEPVAHIRVLDWWHPQYPHSVK